MTSNKNPSGLHEPRIVPVGWLDPGEPYRQGEPSEGFLDKLIALLVDPWEPATAGFLPGDA